MTPVNDRPTFVKGAHGRADREQPLGCGELLRRERDAGDEPGHEAAFGFEERRHRGCDPERGRALVGFAFDPAVDPEQLGLVAGEPHDELVVTDFDAQVPVREPARKDLGDSRPARPARDPVEERSHLGVGRCVHGA